MRSRQTSSFWSMSHALKYMLYGVMICTAQFRSALWTMSMQHDERRGHAAGGEGGGGAEPDLKSASRRREEGQRNIRACHNRQLRGNTRNTWKTACSMTKCMRRYIPRRGAGRAWSSEGARDQRVLPVYTSLRRTANVRRQSGARLHRWARWSPEGGGGELSSYDRTHHLLVRSLLLQTVCKASRWFDSRRAARRSFVVLSAAESRCLQVRYACLTRMQLLT